MSRIIIDLSDENAKKNFQNLLLEYFKRGFLYSSYEINGEWEPTSNVADEKALKEELQYFLDYIKGGFKTFIQNAWKEQLLTLLTQTNLSEKQSVKEKILAKVEEKRKFKELTTNNENEKPLTECQLCKKRIYLSELELENIDLTSIDNFPFPYIHIHSHNGNHTHALLMYLDKDFKVRGRKPAKFLKIQEE